MIKILMGMIVFVVFSFAGNESNVTRTVTVVVPVLTSLSLSSSTTTLNVGETTELTLMGTYSDNTSKTVTQGIAYVITPSNSVEVNGTVLTAKKDGNVTVQAKVGTTLSNTIALTIKWVVDGHVLPPEPDPAVNNATLLGVDVNGNEVRDDVERWLYEEYKDKHPIHIDIAMQAGRAYSQLLKSPLENVIQAKTIYKKCVAPIACKAYYQIYAKYFNEPLLVTEDINIGYFQKFYFNTPRRKELYNKYSRLLSGGMYSTPKLGEGKNLCDFNVSVYKD